MKRQASVLFRALIPLAMLGNVTTAQAEPTKLTKTGNERVELHIQGRFPAKLRFQVSSALERADHRLQARAECRALFQLFGVDGHQTLREALFLLPESDHHHSICTQRSAAAFTTIGGSETYVCPALFGRLSVAKAAVILLHEALHQAGMREWPVEPSAPKSAEINRLIRHRCAL